MEFSISLLEDTISLENIQDTTELMLVTSGYIIRNFNQTSIRLNRNDLHVSLSRQAGSVLEYSGNLQGYCCRIENDCLQHFVGQGILEKELVFINSFMSQYPVRLSPNISARIEQTLRILLLLSREKNPNLTLMLAYFSTIIYEIKKLLTDNELHSYTSKSFQIYQQYNNLLSKHASSVHPIHFFADQLHMTPNHLNKSVKAVSGQTAITLLNQAVIIKAKTLLRQTKKSIAEIAYELGFSDVSYFSRFFKKATKQSPLQYRKLIR